MVFFISKAYEVNGRNRIESKEVFNSKRKVIENENKVIGSCFQFKKLN